MKKSKKSLKKSSVPIRGLGTADVTECRPAPVNNSPCSQFAILF